VDEKNCNIPTHPTYKKHTKNNLSDGEVNIVDKEYLQKSYKFANVDAASIVNMTVKELNLNCDQEWAFQTVENHAVSTNSE